MLGGTQQAHTTTQHNKQPNTGCQLLPLVLERFYETAIQASSIISTTFYDLGVFDRTTTKIGLHSSPLTMSNSGFGQHNNNSSGCYRGGVLNDDFFLHSSSSLESNLANNNNNDNPYNNNNNSTTTNQEAEERYKLLNDRVCNKGIHDPYLFYYMSGLLIDYSNSQFACYDRNDSSFVGSRMMPNNNNNFPGSRGMICSPFVGQPGVGMLETQKVLTRETHT